MLSRASVSWLLCWALAFLSIAGYVVADPAHPNQTLLSNSPLKSSSTSRVASTSLLHNASPSSALSASTLSASSSAAAPSSSAVGDPSTLAEIQWVAERRKSVIVAGSIGNGVSANNISSWLNTLGTDGKWPDSEIDYTTGCDARRANWPAQVHWLRIVTMTSAWHGGLPGADQYVKSPSLLASISNAVDWWFQNDYTNPSCLDSGGTSRCPCGTAGLWNTNWFSNLILIPNLVSQTCLLLNDTLTTDQHTACDRFTGRTFATLGTNVNGLGVPTGANLLDIAKIGIDQGLLNQNATLIADGYNKVHAEVIIENANLADGIRPDGSFGQHGGVLYNGNYGKDFANDVLFLEVQAGGTQFAAADSTKDVFATLVDGDRWMIFRNVITGVLHWDFSVLGRFIVFPVRDSQPTTSISINITRVQELGQEWDNDVLLSTAASLSINTTTANVGSIKGNRMFFNNDYMVQRGEGYVTTLKMFSTRSKNTECINLANPLGFHLSDGTVYTYLKGNEYEDISAAWDWNLIPGTTTDYGNTPLSCDKAGTKGKTTFVGGASNGKIGAAAMTYINPLTSSLNWKKAWFFLDDDVQHVMIPSVNSSSSVPVLSILDQKRLNGPIMINDRTFGQKKVKLANPLTLWHDNVGYVFNQLGTNVNLVVQTGAMTGNWSAIGTSESPPITVNLFAAWLDQGVGPSSFSPVSYTTFPAVPADYFKTKASNTQIRDIRNDAHISAVYDEGHSTAMVVFWDTTGGTVQFTTGTQATVTIKASGNSIVLYSLDAGTVTVSDPSQSLGKLGLTVTTTTAQGQSASKNATITLPSGGLAGSSVTQML